MKHTALSTLLAGALLLTGCPDAKPVAPPPPPPAPPAPATPEPTTPAVEPKAPEPTKTNEVATLPAITYYALDG